MKITLDDGLGSMVEEMCANPGKTRGAWTGALWGGQHDRISEVALKALVTRVLARAVPEEFGDPQDDVDLAELARTLAYSGEANV